MKGRPPPPGGWPRCRCSFAAILLTTAAVGGSTPSPLGAQEPLTEPRVVDVRFEARIGTRGGDDQDRSRVRLLYRLLPGLDADTVPLKGLAFFGNRPDRVEVALGDRAPAPVSLANPRGDLLRGSVPLPSEPAANDTLSLAMTYELHRAIPADAEVFDLVLPILYVDWRPLGAPEDMFVAEVTIPADYAVVESFPTVPKRATVEGGERTYAFQVQVVPSMIRFRGHVGEAPLLTFARRVDLGVVLILLVAGGFGWWGLTRETA